MTLYGLSEKKTQRKIVMEWWNDLSFEEKFFKTIEWLSNQNRDTTERHPNSLTGREIEQIYSVLNQTKQI